MLLDYLWILFILRNWLVFFFGQSWNWLFALVNIPNTNSSVFLFDKAYFILQSNLITSRLTVTNKYSTK